MNFIRIDPAVLKRIANKHLFVHTYIEFDSVHRLGDRKCIGYNSLCGRQTLIYTNEAYRILMIGIYLVD